jgi:hypothetical protein
VLYTKLVEVETVYVLLDMLDKKQRQINRSMPDKSSGMEAIRMEFERFCDMYSLCR